MKNNDLFYKKAGWAGILRIVFSGIAILVPTGMMIVHKASAGIGVHMAASVVVIAATMMFFYAIGVMGKEGKNAQLVHGAYTALVAGVLSSLLSVYILFAGTFQQGLTDAGYGAVGVLSVLLGLVSGIAFILLGSGFKKFSTQHIDWKTVGNLFFIGGILHATIFLAGLGGLLTFIGEILLISNFFKMARGDHKKAAKKVSAVNHTKRGIWWIIGPFLGLLGILVIWAIAQFVVVQLTDAAVGSAAQSAAGSDMLTQQTLTGTVLSLINVILGVLGIVAVLCIPVGIVMGIIHLSKR